MNEAAYERKIVKIGNYLADYVKTVFFCMYCGKQDVWWDCRGGCDYYQGYTVRCESCNSGMSINETPVEGVKPERGRTRS